MSLRVLISIRGPPDCGVSADHSRRARPAALVAQGSVDSAVLSDFEPPPQLRNGRPLSIREDTDAEDLGGDVEENTDRGDGNEDREEDVPNGRLGDERADEHSD